MECGTIAIGIISARGRSAARVREGAERCIGLYCSNILGVCLTGTVPLFFLGFAIGVLLSGFFRARIDSGSRIISALAIRRKRCQCMAVVAIRRSFSVLGRVQAPASLMCHPVAGLIHCVEMGWRKSPGLFV